MPAAEPSLAAVSRDQDSAPFAILIEIARIATEDLDLRPMLQRITDALARKLGWEFVALVRIDLDPPRFTCEATTTSLPTAVHVGYGRALGSGVVGEVAVTGRPILLDDVRTYPNYVETLPRALSEICVPVKHRGRVVAILNAESPRPAAFHGQLLLAEAVAEQIAGAIANARLYEEVKRRAEDLEILRGELEEANRQLQEANLALDQLSRHDDLTGLANRRDLDETLAVEHRRALRAGEPLSLLLVDIDCFKAYNDTYGHQRGDAVLRAIAGALRAGAQRASDLVARYGGEEFVVLLPGLGRDAALERAESLRASAEKLRLSHQRSAAGPWVTVSIGTATMVPEPGDSPARLIAEADRALYAAKAAGRNRVGRP